MRVIPSIDRVISTVVLVLVATHSYAQAGNQGQLPMLPGASVDVAPVASPALSRGASVMPATPMVASGVVPTALPTAPVADRGSVPAGAVPAPTAEPTAAPAAVPTAVPAAITSADVVAGASISTPTRFSFGDSDLSILFLPEQIQAMKQGLTSFESHPARAASPEKEVTLNLDDAAQPHSIEPKEYPVFYLSSIVYHSAGDWSLWLSGHKMTSAKNTTDIKVKSISSEQATFVWTPEYSELLKQRKENKTFANTDKVKHRLAAIQSFSYDEKAGELTFTLRPNQTFAVGYFSLFEGYMETPKMDPALPTSADDKSAEVNPAQAAPQEKTAPQGLLDNVIMPKTFGERLRSGINDQMKGQK